MGLTCNGFYHHITTKQLPWLKATWQSRCHLCCPWQHEELCSHHHEQSGAAVSQPYQCLCSCRLPPMLLRLLTIQDLLNLLLPTAMSSIYFLCWQLIITYALLTQTFKMEFLVERITEVLRCTNGINKGKGAAEQVSWKIFKNNKT